MLPEALAFPSLRLEPPREALVELCAHRLGHARVRLVADQRVTEAIRVLPWQLGARRLHEPLANEAHELARHVRLVGVRREVDDGARPELLPDDRRALERPSLGRVEAVDPRGQKRMNRRGQLDRVTGLRVRDHRRELLGEERIPLGGRDDAPEQIGVVDPERFDELLDLAVGELLELEVDSGKGGPGLEELGP